MNAEKRVWLASFLSAVLLVFYAQFLGRHAKPARPTPTNQAGSSSPLSLSETAPETTPQEITEDILTLESSKLRLEIGKTSTAIRAVVLKEFVNGTKQPLRFGGERPVFLAELGDRHGAQWGLIEQNTQQAVWRAEENGISKELSISLDAALPKFTVELQAKNGSSAQAPIPVRLFATWNRGDTVTGRYNLLEAIFLTDKELPWQRTHLHYLEGATQTRHVPRGTSLVMLSERFFCQAISIDQGKSVRASLIPAKRGVIATEADSELKTAQGQTAKYTIRVYAGPRDFFRLRDAGFEKALPLGTLARIGLVLLVFLKAIAGVVRNYGIAIVLLAGLVTLFLSPFTLISFRSMRKLQELQPKMEQLKRKYENDQQRVNKEMLELFREHRVSPLSGCLPMLLQLPIFFALWSAISHVIEFRGEPFLWIKDLSLPDRLARLPGGLDLNLLPILMAAAMYLQTKLSQTKMSSTPQSTQTLFSGPLMSVLFGVMFYQVPACLVLYWLTNSLVSVFVWYKLAKA